MDRRSFLGQSAVATLALKRACAAAESRPATPPRMKNDRPGLGVIGFRYQGSVIAERAKKYGDIVAIADADKAVLDLSLVDKKVTQQVKATPEEIYAGVTARHQDYRRLLDDQRVDVILIGAPDHWHAKMHTAVTHAGGTHALTTVTSSPLPAAMSMFEQTDGR